MSAALADVRAHLGQPPEAKAYAKKQLHPVPAAPSIERTPFLLERAKGKRLLHIGASGPLHQAFKKVVTGLIGYDRYDDLAEGVIGVDLDDVTQEGLPELPTPGPELIVAGEVLEHLSNPGHFLTRLRKAYPKDAGIPLIITVPNAHSTSGLSSLQKGIENVNGDHVAWYSYKTLKTLLARAGYEIDELYWYNGPPRFAEGLIVVTH